MTLPNEDVESELISLQAGEDAVEQRLDRWLSAQLPQFSRTRLQALIDEGAVTVAGAVCMTASRRLEAGQVVTLVVPPPEDDSIGAEDIPLDIVFEDDDLLVINKPAGLVVHPAPGNYTGTLVNALLFHCKGKLSGIGGVRRPGIVHRLDKETSGLMLVAKTDAAHAGLTAQLADRSLSRVYHALAWGAPSPRAGRVESTIGRHPANRLKMAANVRDGREAATRYAMLENFGQGTACLLECRLETGRTHQVRVQMQLLGHPLLGDTLYGEPENKSRSRLRKGRYEDEAQDAILGFARQALHAREISFIHPIEDEEMNFEVEPPADFQALQEQLSSLRA